VTATAGTEYHTSGLVRLTRPQLVGTLTGLLLAALLAAIDQTIVGTAEPRIIAQLSGFDRYPWIATAYLLTSTVSVPIFASLSDIHGRKPFFMLGATLFTATSALCGAAGTLTFLPIDGMGQLILFRGLQGVGAGMVMGLLFTIVGDIFSPAERGRYQVRPQMETAFSRFPGGPALLQTLFDNVRASLASGLHLIFVCSAAIMVAAVLLHLMLRSEPLRTRAVEPELV
jgi:MFS family permease